MELGFASLILVAVAGLVFAVVGAAVMVFVSFRRQVRRLGYASLGEYLRAVPRTDEEKRDAVSLALKGLVLCFLGLVFPPLLLIGVFPLFFGARKVAWTSMGLGLVDDADLPGT